MSKTIAIIVALGLSALPIQALARCNQTDNEVGIVGLDYGDGRVYVGVVDSQDQCGCSYFIFLPSNTDTDKALSVLLAAKLSGKKVRIDAPGRSQCSNAFAVYLE